MPQEVRRKVRQFDTNGDGSLTLAEFRLGKQQAAAAPDREPDDGPLTKDELMMVALATDGNSRVNQVKNTPTGLTGAEQLNLFFDQYQKNGRARNVAAGLLACDILQKTKAANSEGQWKLYRALPGDMLRLAGRATGMAIRGERLPPPFSKSFYSLTESALAGLDQMRRDAVQLNRLKIAFEYANFATVTEIENNFATVLGKTPIDSKELQVRQLPGGQSLDLKYIGTRPLTNVMLFSEVRQTRGPSVESELMKLFVQDMNRTFSPQGQGKDANDYIDSHLEFARIPKFRVMYIPKLKPADQISFAVGYMERDDAMVHNKNTLALYCDEGRITKRDSAEFPAKAKPVARKTNGSDLGNRYSAANPGKGDRLYVGSIWRGRSKVTAASGEIVRKDLELTVTSRGRTVFRVTIYDTTNDRVSTATGTINNGRITLRASHVVPHLKEGRLKSDRMTFTPPRGTGKERASLQLKYIPPKRR
ncbi:MAG: hypothetical protein AB8G99_16325 [Planctomycetaceae bacterium]